MNAGLKIFWPRLMMTNQHHLDNNQPNQANNRQRMEQNQMNSCDKYLTMISANPLTLKQLARIQIRNRLIAKMKDFHFISNLLAIISDENDPIKAFSSNSLYASSSQSMSSSIIGSTIQSTNYKSILQILIEQLTDLPRILQYYLYEFPDCPPVPQDVDVFIHY